MYLAKALAKLVEEQMGFEQYQFIKDNIAVVEQSETQRLVNQAQQSSSNRRCNPSRRKMLLKM